MAPSGEHANMMTAKRSTITGLPVALDDAVVFAFSHAAIPAHFWCETDLGMCLNLLPTAPRMHWHYQYSIIASNRTENTTLFGVDNTDSLVIYLYLAAQNGCPKFRN